MTVIEALRLAFQHYQAGRLTEAREICRAILKAVPQQVDTLQVLGVIEVAAGQSDAAARVLRDAVAVAPDLAVDAWCNLGVIAQNSGRHGLAVACQSRAIQLRPGFAEGYLNRGAALSTMGDRDAAVADFLQAAALKPLDALPVNNVGMVLREKGQIERAVAAHRQAIALVPDFVDAWRDLGHALREKGRLTQSAAAYATAFRLAPGRTDALSYHLFTRQAVCDWNGYDALCQRIGQVIDDDAGIVLPLATLAIDTTADQQFRSARLFYRQVVGRPAAGPAAGAATMRRTSSRGDGRLRIGYCSADFHEHATAYLAAEMFELHDRERFEIIAYSFGQDDGSAMRRRLLAAFDGFRDVRSVGFDRVVRTIEDDGIDILVDLKGYTKQSRLDLLSCRLAPVQAAYLGYPGTIGSDTMDYVIGDRFVTPLEHQPFYSERLVVMPDAYQINDRHRPLDGRIPTRAEYGLPDDGFVFCSFNTTYKMSPTMFGAWMRLLHAVPGSVLWLFEAQAEAVANLRREAVARGVDPARLVFAPKRPLPDHLARYRIADLGLDTFPYTGHTTTSDALWMGLPVVTFMGETFASRVAASLLNAAGLPGLVTTSLDGFEALARELAAAPDRLVAMRRQLEETRTTAPLFDSRRFTRHLERAFQAMWDIHTAGGPPRAIVVPPLPPGTPP